MSRFLIGSSVMGGILLGIALVIRLSAPLEKPSSNPPVAPSRPVLNTRATIPFTPSIRHAPDELAARTKMLVEATTTRLRKWEDEDEPGLRDQRMRELETLLEGADLPTVLQQLPPELLRFATGLPIFQRWIATDPARAAEWMSSRPAISEAHASDLVHHWATVDPNGLRDYLEGLPAGEWKQRLLGVVSRNRIVDSPETAIAWASRMTDDGRRTGVLEMAATAWGERDARAAARWAAQVEDSDLRNRLLGSIASGYAGADPAGAAQWLVASMPAGPLLARSAAEVASRWAERDPAMTAQWVADFPAGEARDLATENLINVWANRDRAAATAWIASLPAGSLRNQAGSWLAALPARPTTALPPASRP